MDLGKCYEKHFYFVLLDDFLKFSSFVENDTLDFPKVLKPPPTIVGLWNQYVLAIACQFKMDSMGGAWDIYP